MTETQQGVSAKLIYTHYCLQKCLWFYQLFARVISYFPVYKSAFSTLSVSYLSLISDTIFGGLLTFSRPMLKYVDVCVLNSILQEGFLSIHIFIVNMSVEPQTHKYSLFFFFVSLTKQVSKCSCSLCVQMLYFFCYIQDFFCYSLMATVLTAPFYEGEYINCHKVENIIQIASTLDFMFTKLYSSLDYV